MPSEKLSFEERCLSCKGFDLGGRQQYATSIDAVRTTAGNGCLSCQIIIQVLVPHHEKKLLSTRGRFLLLDNWMPYFRFGLAIINDLFRWRVGLDLSDFIEMFKLPGQFKSALPYHLPQLRP
jgi:hypothetical protein